ncbi:hypothetical protein [Photobacterium leiognathi]|uniref:hypothetical protein n=1 Tax=Photobacterium leiognathi TaxID=553611 RepID=UPI002980EFBE|nr:hypothetical protein [Photobacterium leiognathi]
MERCTIAGYIRKREKTVQFSDEFKVCFSNTMESEFDNINSLYLEDDLKIGWDKVYRQLLDKYEGNVYSIRGMLVL